MKKKVIMLSCIAAVAIATFVGTKAFQSNAYENGLLNQNVEALSQGDGDGDGSYFACPTCYPYFMTCNVQISRRKTCLVDIIWCEGGGEGCNPKKCPTHNAG